MKNIMSRLFVRTAFFAFSILFLAALSNAQIGQLGIYGSPPESFRANVRFVLLQDYPEYDGGLIYYLPVNGLKNFNFFYKPDGSGFLPAGNYKLAYLNGTLTQTYGTEIVYYSPNAGHTNGLQVHPFNNPPPTPRGIHGNVFARIPNGGGSFVPLENATVITKGIGGKYNTFLRANGNGYFSAYYLNGEFAEFLPAIDHYDILIVGNLNGCSYETIIYDFDVFYHPSNSTDPSLPSYFVTEAEYDAGNRILTSRDPGCQP